MIKKSMLIWLLIVPLAILNGGLREGILEPMIGSKYANPISGIILCILIFIVSFLFIPRLGKGEKGTYLKIGLLWVLATVVFETGLSFLMGIGLNEIINSYNITTGNLWLIVVIFIGIVPLLIAKIRRNTLQ
ncbi:MAG: hypothetical protein FWC64_02835 [Treponema sp.]|nr:hypothetical protein [Treponema sp.]